MRSLLIAVLAASLLGAAPTKAKGKGKGAATCPFVGTGDIDKDGNVQNVVGLDLKSGLGVQAFDVDGAVGKLHANGSGELRFSGGVPAKVRSSTFLHALFVADSVKGVHVAEPAKDLPDGIFADAIQIYLADAKGGRVALVSIPGQTDDEACSEIDCKVAGKWKRCWTDCK